MAKPVKTLEELHALVRQKIKQSSTLDGAISPGMPYWHERDAQGCNWDLEFWRGPGHLAVQAHAFAVVPLRKEYDAPDKQ